MSSKEARNEEDLHWDESEAKEMLKALRQPLLIQTPLQFMLESIFNKMKAQTNAFLEMKEKVEHISRNDLSATELLDRIKLLEGMVKELTHSKLSPFMQAEILRRLEAVEGLAGRSWDVASELKTEKTKDIVPRLERVEAKLQGVYNLHGKLIAVEDMAKELGMDIADMEYVSPLVAGGLQSQGSMSNTPSSLMPSLIMSAGSAPVTPQPQSSREFPLGRDISSAAPQASAPGTACSTASTKKPSSRLMDLEAQISVFKEESTNALKTVEMVRDEVMRTNAVLSSAAENTAARLAVIEDVQAGLRSNLSSEVAALRAEIHKQPQVSFADLAKVQSAVDSAANLALSSANMAKELQEKEVVRIDAELEKHGKSLAQLLAPRDLDAFFSAKIQELEKGLAAHEANVRDTVAALEAGHATKAELAELKDLVDTKASKEDVRAAVTAHTHSIVRTVQEQMSPHLLSALAGPHQDMVPVGPSGVKFRCLSCNTELSSPQRPAPVGPLPSSRGFLPKLEGVVNKYGDPPNPMGPGLNAAEMRRLAETRLHGMGPPGTAGGDSTSSPPASRGLFSNPNFAAEFDNWMEPGDIPRSPAQGSNTVKYSTPSSPFNSQSRSSKSPPTGNTKPGTAPRTPVFV